MTIVVEGEQTPLLIASRTDSTVSPADDVQEEQSHRTSYGSASFAQTVVNICKTCAGTGTLALPYATNNGGILLHILGLTFVALWNVYSVHRLLDCLSLLPRRRRQCCHNNKQQQYHHHPPEGTSTLGQVAWYSLGGRYGLFALDVMMIMLLGGIVITYEDAIIGFLADTPLSSGSLSLDAIVTSVLIGILSIVPNMGYLAHASAFGLTTLTFVFCVIAWYGTHYRSTHTNDGDDDARSSSSSWVWWWLLPKNGMSGVSTWFGCIVFGFGMVPLTYNMQESMVEPQQMMGASIVGLGLVGVAYGIVGIGLLILYPNIQGDLLQELPQTGVVPTVVRLAMVVVVMVTAPLLVVPCGELIEGKLSLVTTGASCISEPILRVVVRLSICIVCSIISIGVPGFVQVLSFVGCFCVALVSFVVPPLLHLVLLLSTDTADSAIRTTRDRFLDSAMLLWGISATVITSLFTLREMKS